MPPERHLTTERKARMREEESSSIAISRGEPGGKDPEKNTKRLEEIVRAGTTFTS